MTTPVSKKSNFKKYFQYKISTMKTRIILMGILGFLSFPVLSIATAITAFITDQEEAGAVIDERVLMTVYSFFTSSVFICFISLLVMLCMGYFIAISNFSYLHNRNIVDMNYSLPLTRTTRFWADFLSGLTVHIVPYILSSLLGLGIFSIGLTWLKADGDLRKGLIFLYPTILSYLLSGLALFVLLYVFTLLFVSACGNLLEAATYPLIMNLVIPGAISLIVGCTIVNARGVSFGNIVTEAIAFSSPLGFIISEFSTFVGLRIDTNETAPLSAFINWKILVPYCLLIAGMIVASYFMNKVRKPENTGKSFAFGWVYHVIMSFIIFCYAGLFLLIRHSTDAFVGGGTIFIILMVFFSFITFLIIDVITNRGFKRFGIATLRYLGMLGCSVLIVLSLIASRGFMMGYYLPKAEEVQSVKVNVLSDITDDSNASEMTFTSQEAIDIILSLHKDWIDIPDSEYNKYNTYSYYQKANFEYTLKNGSVVSRNYSSYITLPETYTDKLYRLYVTAESKQLFMDSINQSMKNEWVSTEFYDSLKGSFESLSEEQAIELLQAYKNDFMAQTYEQISNPQKRVIGKINIRQANDRGILYTKSYIVYDYMLETIKKIKSLGFVDMTLPEVMASTKEARLNIGQYSYKDYLLLDLDNPEIRALFLSLDLAPRDEMHYDRSWSVDLKHDKGEVTLFIDETSKEKAMDLFWKQLEQLDMWDELQLYPNGLTIDVPSIINDKAEQEFKDIIARIRDYQEASSLYADESTYSHYGYLHLYKIGDISSYYQDSFVTLNYNKKDFDAILDFFIRWKAVDLYQSYA